MSSDERDYYYEYCDTDTDIGYQMLVDKHINIYEPLFDENETYFNRYSDQQIEQVITIIDSDNEESDQSKAQEKQQQTTSNEKNSKNIDKNLFKVSIHIADHKRNSNDNVIVAEETTESKEREIKQQQTNNEKYIDTNLSKVQTHYDRSGDKPKYFTDYNNNNVHKRNIDDSAEEETKKSKERDSDEIYDEIICHNLYKVCRAYDRCEWRTYACQWWSCQFESCDYLSLESHLINEHISIRVFDNFTRSFVSLNVYQYKCTHSNCDYSTTARESILNHVFEHNYQCK